jgi:hypothetical protein
MVTLLETFFHQDRGLLPIILPQPLPSRFSGGGPSRVGAAIGVLEQPLLIRSSGQCGRFALMALSRKVSLRFRHKRWRNQDPYCGGKSGMQWYSSASNAE